MKGRALCSSLFLFVLRTNPDRLPPIQPFNLRIVGANLVFALIIIVFAPLIKSGSSLFYIPIFVRSTKQIGICGETGYPLCEMSVKTSNYLSRRRVFDV